MFCFDDVLTRILHALRTGDMSQLHGDNDASVYVEYLRSTKGEFEEAMELVNFAETVLQAVALEALLEYLEEDEEVNRYLNSCIEAVKRSVAEGVKS